MTRPSISEFAAALLRQRSLGIQTAARKTAEIAIAAARQTEAPGLSTQDRAVLHSTLSVISPCHGGLRR